MISCDTNVLFAATVPEDPNHEAALRLLSDNATNNEFIIAQQALVELYGLLRNPKVLEKPLSAAEAVAVIDAYRANPDWSIVDVPEDARMMENVWRRAAKRDFARRRIHDVRLAETLKFAGVTVFYTRNTRDFGDCGFDELINPFED